MWIKFYLSVGIFKERFFIEIFLYINQMFIIVDRKKFQIYSIQVDG